MDIRESTNVSIALATQLLSQESRNSNVFFSPLSISTAFAMLTLGSRGETRDQMLSFLKSNNIDDLNSLYSQLVSLVFADGSPIGGPRLSFANGLWVDQTLTLKPSFKQVVHGVYTASSKQADFQNKAVEEVTNEVNSWAEKQTSGLIKDILPAGAVNNTTRLIFANAVYFKGTWNQKFDPSKTKDHDFHLLNGTKIQAPFMTTKAKQFVSSYDGFKVLGLPYLKGQDKRRFTMYFYLPDATDGLPSLIQKISSGGSDFLDRHVPYQKVEVGQFLIPKFKISFAFEASEMLKELGLVLPFSGGEGLTEMVESVIGGNLFVSSIHHKSFVEVNEEGTEAAADSLPVVMLRSMRTDDKIDFVADRPFLFLIKEDMTGVVPFTGQVVDPRDS